METLLSFQFPVYVGNFVISKGSIYSVCRPTVRRVSSAECFSMMEIILRKIALCQ